MFMSTFSGIESVVSKLTLTELTKLERVVRHELEERRDKSSPDTSPRPRVLGLHQGAWTTHGGAALKPEAQVKEQPAISFACASGFNPRRRRFVRSDNRIPNMDDVNEGVGAAALSDDRLMRRIGGGRPS